MDRSQAFKITGPRQTVLVSCVGPNKLTGKDIVEIVPVTSHMLVSLEPFIYAVALDSGKDADKIITETGTFAVNFIPEEHSDKVETLKSHPLKTDKRYIPGISLEECEKIEGVRLKDVAAYLECEVVETLRYGERVMFLGKVVEWEEVKHAKRLFHGR